MYPPSCDQHDCSPLKLPTKFRAVSKYFGKISRNFVASSPLDRLLISVVVCRRAMMTTRRRTGRRRTPSWRGACRSPSGAVNTVTSSNMAHMSASGWPPSSPPTSPPSLSKTSTPTTKIKRWPLKHFMGYKLKILMFQTFIVISKGKDIFRFSAEDSMWFLSPFSPVRRVAIHVLVHPLFSLIIIATILINCLMMILTPSERIESTEWVCLQSLVCSVPAHPDWPTPF